MRLSYSAPRPNAPSVQFQVERDQSLVRRQGNEHKLTRQQLAVLQLLVAEPGRDLQREFLIAEVWPGDRVDRTHNLEVVISKLRSVLGDSERHLIQNVPGGYRF